MVNAYLTGPAKKIAVRQVNRPAETTTSWLSLPCCHTSLAFSVTWSGSSSSRSCNPGMPPLLPLFVVDLLEGLGFGGMTPPLKVCGVPGEVDFSDNWQKDTATRKAQTRRASARNTMTLVGEDTEWVVCGRKKHVFI